MDRAVYSERVILRYSKEPKLERISIPRKQQGQDVAHWRTLVTGLNQLSFLPVAAAVAFAAVCARADDAALAPREAPAKSLPVPTDVSPGMQKFIAAPLNPMWHDLWKTGEEWRNAADKMDAGIVPTIPAMAERLHVKIEPSTMDGVKVFIVTPDEIPPENRNRLLIHIHGGCYVLSPAEAGRRGDHDGGLEHFKVISVDYRMPPEAYFPAALDDAMTVWKAVSQRTTDPAKIGDLRHFRRRRAGACEVIAGETRQAVNARRHRIRHADVGRDQDRRPFQTNAMVDNVLVSTDGFLRRGTCGSTPTGTI